MFERFTDTSRKAVAIANRETLRLRGRAIGDVELLLGIIWISACSGTAVLCRLGIDLTKLRSQLEAESREMDDGSAPRKLPQTRDFKLVVEAAIAVSAELGHERVETQHMLLGLLRNREIAASRILALHEVSFERVRQAVLDSMGRARTTGEA